jgi:hypothetical protein
MNAIKKKLNIPKNRIIHLRIPEKIPINQPVEVIMIFNEDKNSYKAKIKLLEKIKSDKAFLEDMKQISDDYNFTDSEGWN